MQGVALLLVLLGLFWIWYAGARAKEKAILHVRLACEQNGMQLLDGTIYLRKVWPARLQNGQLGLLRFYQFEYTDNGARRFRGLIVMTADKMEYLQMEVDGHSIITTGEQTEQ